MKKIIAILLFAINSMVAFAQTAHTDEYLQNYTDSLIRRITLTSKNVANTFKLGWDSKVSILSPKLGTSSTVGYVWTATNTSGNGSWQAPTGTVTAVNGTTNRITSTGGATPMIDISSTFEGLLGKIANPLSQFASTTSSQFAGIISDETGTGNVVLSASPAFTGTPTGPTAIAGTNTTQLATTAHAFANYQAKSNDLTAIAALSPTNDDILQRKSGNWVNRTMAQLSTDLALQAYPLTTDYDLWTQISGVPSRIGIGSASQVLAVNGSGTSIGWATITTAAWPLSGTGLFTAGVTIAQAGNTLDYTSTLGISSSSVFQQITNSSNVLYQLTTQGFPTFNLYNSSAKIASILFITAGGSGSGIRFQDATATTRYNLVQNVSGNYFSIAENSPTNTKLAIGLGTGGTALATAHIRGAGTSTGTGLRVESSAGTSIISSTDGGDIKFNGKIAAGSNTSATATLELLAGTTAIGPFRMNSGPLLTSPLVGMFEFLTDKFYATITTGTARKEFTLNDAALTSSSIPIATTNGRLTSWTDPNATTIVGWDDTDNANVNMTVGSGITYTHSTHTLSVSGGGIGGSTGSVDKAMLTANGTGGSTVQSVPLTVTGNTNDVTFAAIGASSDISLFFNVKGTSGSQIKFQDTNSSGLAIVTGSSRYIGFLGGDATIYGTGRASGGGTASSLTVAGGDGIGTNDSGGSLILRGGIKNGTGTPGIISLVNKAVLSDIIRLTGYTVSTLPTGTANDVAIVTDALAPSFLVTVVGGGSVVTPVFYNGTNWVSF